MSTTATRVVADGPFAEVTATEAAEQFGITIAAVTNWVNRGHLTPSGIDPSSGRKLYRVLDLAKAECLTRKRARR